MEQKKLIKPKSCKECPAAKVDKSTLICRCGRGINANILNLDELQEMYNKCPIAWDLEEKEGQK